MRTAITFIAGAAVAVLSLWLAFWYWVFFKMKWPG